MSQQNDKIDVLVVEDNPVNLELFTSILDETSFEYLTAEDGMTALELARQNPPRLVLMDIQLPGMDGIEVMQKLKEIETTKNAIVIAVTAHAMKGDRETFLKLGFDEYISKPVKTKELISIIEHYLAAR